MSAPHPTETRDRLIYKCPHCGARVEVNETQLNEVVDCPNPACGRPFEVAPPKAALAPSDDFEGKVYKSHGAADVEGELIVRHPAMFRTHPFRYLGLMAALIGGLAVLYTTWTQGMLIIAAIAGAVAAGALLTLGVWSLQRYFQTLIVTNRRTIHRQGIIARKTSEVQHDDVRNLQVDQTMLQRFLNVGSLSISSSGQSDVEIHIEGLPDPNGVAETIRNYQ